APRAIWDALPFTDNIPPTLTRTFGALQVVRFDKNQRGGLVLYQPKVVVINGVGDHVRYVPAAKARAMVSCGNVAPSAGSGRVPAVAFTRPASGFAERSGDHTVKATGVRFCRWFHLEQSAARVVEHHLLKFTLKMSRLQLHRSFR